MYYQNFEVFIENRDKLLQKSKYYNYSLINKVEKDFCLQAGDPKDEVGKPKNGASIFAQTHGEGARYFEANPTPRIVHDRPGLVSMINNGSVTYQ